MNDDLLKEESYEHILWLGELPEMGFPQLHELQGNLMRSVGEELVPETVIFYNVPPMYLVPAGDRHSLSALRLHAETHSGGPEIIESELAQRPRVYLPGQLNLSVFLNAARLQGGNEVAVERLEDALIGSLLRHDIYAFHAKDSDGGGNGLLGQRGKRLAVITSRTESGVHVVELMINVSSDTASLEALPGSEEFGSLSEETIEIINTENLKQELGKDLATSLGKKPQRLNLFGLGNALLRT